MKLMPVDDNGYADVTKMFDLELDAVEDIAEDYLSDLESKIEHYEKLGEPLYSSERKEKEWCIAAKAKTQAVLSQLKAIKGNKGECSNCGREAELDEAGWCKECQDWEKENLEKEQP